MTRIRAHSRRAALLLAGIPVLFFLAAPVASAHPLGNFTVNRYDGLTLHSDRVDDLVVVDTAEIPTLQAMPALDSDHDGRLSAAEAATHARTTCATIARAIRATAQPQGTGSSRAVSLHLQVMTTDYRLVRGQAGLDTGRLECRFSAPADLGATGTLELTTGVDPSHIGWHEITAQGDGTRIGSSDVPAASISNELRKYPADLLSNPPDARHTRVTLGNGPGAVAANAPGSGLLGGWYAALDARLGSLTDRDRLTLPVGLLAVLLALVLGAGHAALPGHGKTIMAAYLAGRQGRPRDAVTVATTVTLTHTASVLVLGTALSVSSALVGEQALAWLGTISGLVIIAAGIWLLPAALRTARTRAGARSADRAPAHDGHTHGNHEHGHDHPHSHDVAVAAAAEPVGAGELVTASVGNPAVAAAGTTTEAALATGPESHHDHAAPSATAHQHHEQRHQSHSGHDHPHGHSHGGHGHSHGLFGHHHLGGSSGRKKGGLIGIGIAGGLVPSPSALIVLLGSIALGRTAFGVVLVLCYGLGMAATLAAAGLLLLKLRDRIPALNGGRAGRLATWGARITPLSTALLILAVGMGTALRAMPL
ncbi:MULTISPECIES: HoxN/HupN/NixA family nickel/cobalt transporter [Streptomyces]|uniref:HoxN/HupN/NixA family nickel/cobalt transporter n=1 Tax=Streptomyces TaxID=1883 RepID=UPI0018E02F25|nr:MULTISPECIES: nickel transporter [Streptomyces]MCZ4102929.1 nickel transporter [Streptomyces sp. H39-C1]